MQSFVSLPGRLVWRHLPLLMLALAVFRSGATGSQPSPSSAAVSPLAATSYASADVGAPPLPGSITPVSGGYDVTGSGGDIAGTKDQFQFASKPQTGNFDLQVRIADLTVTDPYVKGGLMARESLKETSAFAAVFASSAQLGSFFEWRVTNANASANLTGPALKFPASYPWAWLRLRRNGNDFSGYGSFDGQQWQLLGSATMTLSNQLYFGMAVTSDTTNAAATARFRDLSPTQSTASFSYVPRREPIGPSNRRTGLIFSEIMYHPKARTDGRNLEFIELYNAEAVFIDLTGWKVTGQVEYAFPEGFQIQAGQFVVIAADPGAIQEVYGIPGVLGPYQQNLSNKKGTLTLVNQAGAVRAQFTYSGEAPWPVSPDGAGHSLTCLRPSYGEEDVRSWGPSELIGGSPGYDDPVAPNPWAGVVINEFEAAPQGKEMEFIELYNASNLAVDLSGCFLTDSPKTNKFRIPDGTLIDARGWVSFTLAQLGFGLGSAGETIYLVSADQARVLDAIRFGPQETGVSSGRSPDGGPVVRRLATPTPSQANAPWKAESIVINELMYKPVSDDPDDQYIELYNRDSAATDLSGWQFTSGVTFTFPAGSTIPANGYLVVARNVDRLLANYPQLNATNAVGNFTGKLGSNGDHVALARPVINRSSTNYIAVAEVSYLGGGRWPALANGGGASLELVDAHADPLLAANWAASDETQKSSWANYEYTGVLNAPPLANQTFGASKFYIISLGESECLIDSVEVFKAGSTNVLVNSDFENGTTNWNFYGTHIGSTVDNSGAFAGANCLHLRSTEVGDEGPNSVRGSLSTTLPANATITIRAKARWLSGWPELLLRVRGNGIEFPLTLSIPKNLGTPGLPNSRRVPNAGPAISEVTHFPPVPAANQAVLVTARISDPDGVSSVQLLYRADPETSSVIVPMRDDGTGGDLLAGDGIYTGRIPGRSAGVVAFQIQAKDKTTGLATTTFPNNTPVREALIRWADPTPFGSFTHYHLWSTSASATDLSSKPGLDRKYRDCTIIYHTRTIYNAGWRNKGSPFHNGVGSYRAGFPEDELLLGASSHVFRSTGNSGNEATEMADDMAYWIGEKLGIPFNHSSYIRLYRNGTLHYPVDYDVEVPDRSIAKDWFGGGGVDDALYKISGWFEYDNTDSNGSQSLVWATFQKKPASAPPFRLGAYRFNWLVHPGARTANDFTRIFALVAAANAADKVTSLSNLADMEEWMRVLAHRRVIGDWDSWSYNTGQNMYLYAPLGQKARLMSWDMDFVLGLGDTATQNQLFAAPNDSVVAQLFAVPTYKRMLLRAYQDAVNGPLRKEVSDPQFDSRRSTLVKNGVASSPPTSLKSYVSSRRAFLQKQIATLDAAAFTVNTTNSTSANAVATITGVAPAAVASIEVNGIPYPITWTGVMAWSIRVPLGAGANALQIAGKDLRGNLYPGATNQVTITYNGVPPRPQDWITISEILYHPTVKSGDFIEIYNRHPNYAFDLSGFVLQGVTFTFPPGSFIQPGRYLVLARDPAVFASTYGPSIPVAGQFSGGLKSSHLLQLIKPEAASETIVSEVRYDGNPPWPVIASGSGLSLQRIDLAQDARRPGNWAVSIIQPLATPGAPNSVAAALPDFPPLWINEVEPANPGGLRDSTGQPKPWIEVYNAGDSPVSLENLYLADDPENLAFWPFPAGAQLSPGEFRVIFTDGQSQLTTASEFHTAFHLPASGGVVTLSRLESGRPRALDSVSYATLAAGHSFGSFPDGQPITRLEFALSTPGGPNLLPLSAPTIDQVALTGTQLSLHWAAVPGQTYRIEFKDDLNQPAWTQLATGLVATSDSLSANVDLNGVRKRFVRVVEGGN